ncbi:amine oxidase [Polychaeton citri CBS 116435]|uniref:Amine oxidase n=1 Tax=Polychaeton citri CBS 116435 TaxID=1314669 RepID=A0A9P4UKW2_9PEZI|nr:amine oxidase [Polychaeton citri CBS 116435]
MPSALEFSTEVIIVGAGLSGLQAAHSLTDAGITSVVLEARARVGGKTLSIRNGDGVGIADLGAEWLNDTTQPRVYKLAEKLGLEFNEVKVQGESVLQGFENELFRHEYGQQAPLPNGEGDLVNLMKELFEAEYIGMDLEKFDECQHDDVTLDEFVRSRGGGSGTLATVAVWTRVMLGCEPSELSASYFFVYCKSQGGLMKMRSSKLQGRYVTVKTGTQSIAEGLLRLLPSGSVKLSTAVKSIVQRDDSVEVLSMDGHVFRGKKVILAISTPLYLKINFEPPLPAGKAFLVSSTRLGYYTKTLATYSKPWWRDNGLSGASQSFLGPAAATRDTSDDAVSKYRITSFIAGSPGEQWSQLDANQRKAAALGQLADMFGSDEANHPTEYIEHQWSAEEWSMGCPCPYTPPGVLRKAGNHLTEPYRHIHFVGTETAPDWKGYMEGALASGSRGAEEIVKLLREPVA